MIILDTDIISVLDLRTGNAFRNVARRLAAVPDDELVCATIISFEEQMRGWLGQIAIARGPDAQILSYGRLHRLLREYQSRHILPYDAAAAAAMAAFRRQRIRVGTMDMRIGAIAVSFDALLISRNLKDFKRIPNLRVEDWTI